MVGSVLGNSTLLRRQERSVLPHAGAPLSTTTCAYIISNCRTHAIGTHANLIEIPRAAHRAITERAENRLKDFGRATAA
jgi:hypothetical protein